MEGQKKRIKRNSSKTNEMCCFLLFAFCSFWLLFVFLLFLLKPEVVEQDMKKNEAKHKRKRSMHNTHSWK
jgi:hypothetical protein